MSNTQFHTKEHSLLVLPNWWKYVTAALLLYVFTAGLLIPLRPGIESATSSTNVLGEPLRLEVKGYNTYFSEGKNDLRVWLKYDDKTAIQAKKIEVSSQQLLTAEFEVPNSLPDGKKNGMFTLLVDNGAHGVSVMPSAIALRIKSDSLGSSSSPSVAWSSDAVHLNFQKTLAFPYRNILNETIRNLYYHVPLWFGMIALFTASLWFSIVHLRNSGPDGNYQKRQSADWWAQTFAEIGWVFGVLGLTTGMLWANYTWGKPWTNDVKLNMSAVLMMVYTAYLILRMAFDDEQTSARIGAVYNIFAYASIFPLIFVIPRLQDSLHPGNGGNPAMGGEDLDNTMRLVFYPSVIGFIMLGFWIAEIAFRIKRLRKLAAES